MNELIDYSKVDWIKVGVCHECCEPVDTTRAIKLTDNVWECPNCQYPNSRSDLGIGVCK